MSLVPETSLLFCPSLAATIGLEEAIMLQVLQNCLLHGDSTEENQYLWLTVTQPKLLSLIPFWSQQDTQRILNNLRDKGIILITSAPLVESEMLRFAINEPVYQRSSPAIAGSMNKQSIPQSGQVAEQPLPTLYGNSNIGANGSSRSLSHSASRSPSHTNYIAPSWEPEPDVLQQLALYGIPDAFAQQILPEFITYWTERGEPHYSWGSKFIKHCLREWRKHQTKVAKQAKNIPMNQQWRPSQDAMEILTSQSGISLNFVEDAIPEFVLYWMERGDNYNAWNSRFILHIKKQWARYTTAVEHESLPHPIPHNWQPSEALFDVLELSNIPRNFAEPLVPEFILFWQEKGQAHSSWNTKFLQQVKRAWAYSQTQDSSNGQRQAAHRSGSTRARPLIDELSDRSWAGA